ncbi:MAG TPA: twin-arginine translocation signal domain-containing protein, partial [Candidatus Binatia bacterium]|nr:twin-arginine translocation signal domain-containing protein [Candidatus Binatia bacterium]
MATRISRRDFLRASSLSAAALVLGALRMPAEAADAATPSLQPLAGYGDWRDLYRDKWTWDRVVKCTHTRVNCISGCSW